jgi:hypothetical protein
VASLVPIRIDIFERAFKRYQKAPGASFGTLAKKMRVPVAQLREWRRTGQIPFDKLELLAAALNTPSHKLVRTPDGELLPETEASSAILPNTVGHNVLTVARTLRSYTKFLGYQRNHPQYPHAHVVHHSGKEAFYANLFLESSASRQTWLFSIWFGLRMDYGFVHLTRDMDVALEPILQDQDPASTHGFAAETEDGKSIVSVRTWFGRPSCDFIVHSDKPFALRWTKDPIVVPGAVTFLKNPFQREE